MPRKVTICGVPGHDFKDMATLVASQGATLATTRSGRPRKEYGRGDEIGRYVILSVLGEGGMGVVYAAYDPELDRKVAVKLLHVDERDRGPETEGVTRLQREAQALARLSHPNVLTIHDVGVHQGHVFLAMEFVEGGTLTEWLNQASRTPAEILEKFVAAGRGLIAAHQVELVHRDFKPENVLVGSDGRPRVADFGLAVGRGGHTATGDAREESVTSTLDRKLTVTGRAVGTPYYMAPEQFFGGQVDAAADQFSFCVALYDSLYQQHPFGGSTVAELRVNLMSGQVREPPSVSGVTNQVRRAIFKGLQLDPEDRHATLAELLELLTPQQRRRKFPVLGAMLLATGTLVGGYLLAGDSPEPCPVASQRVAEVWNDDLRKNMHKQFSQSELPYREQVWETVEQTLDTYTDQWLDGHREACEDTRVRGELSEAMLDRRMVCLESRLDELGALVEVMLEADDTAIEKSVVAVETLPSIGRCHNIAAMQAEALNLPDPEIAATRKRLRPALDHARALQRLGHFEPAQKIYDELEKDVFAAPDRGLHALFRHRLAALQHHFGDDDKAEEFLYNSLADAISSGNAGEIARVAAEFLELRSSYQTNAQQVDSWYQIGKAALERHGRDDDLEMLLIRRYGSALRSLGENVRALEAHRESLDMHLRLVGPDHYNTAVARYNLASVYYQLGRYDECDAEFDSAVSRLSASVGETHPTAITVLEGRGIRGLIRGRYAQAVEDLQTVLERRIALYGDKHRSVDDSRDHLASAYGMVRRYEDARKLFEQVLRNRKRDLGEDNRYVGWTYGNLTGVYKGLERYDDAREAAARSREILKKVHGGDHPEVAKSYLMMGRLEAALKNFDAAKEELARGMKILVDTKHETTPDMVESHYVLATIAIEQKDVDAAIKHMAEVRRIDNGREKRLDSLAEYRLVEAQIAWLKGDKDAAHSAREEVISMYQQLGRAWEQEIDKAKRWFNETPAGGT